MSASEAVERSVKTSHERHILESTLKQVEDDLLKAQREIKRYCDEIHEEKQKYKSLYLEKLAAERKSSELLVSKARMEVNFSRFFSFLFIFFNFRILIKLFFFQYLVVANRLKLMH